jgi:hypothetical protein
MISAFAFFIATNVSLAFGGRARAEPEFTVEPVIRPNPN